MPREVWCDLFSSAEQEIGILAYSALFLADDAGILELLWRRAHTGVNVRILLGDPESEPMKQRGKDEQAGEAIPARARNALLLFRALLGVRGAEIRTHSTILYSSIYLTEMKILVNQHIYGLPAAKSPVIEVDRKSSPEMAETYARSFESTWQDAHPIALQ